MSDQKGFLEKIIKIKKEEIRKRKTPSQQKEMEEMIPSLPFPRDFMEAISRHSPIAVIAEVKRASPSLGMINEDLDILQIAREYEKGGASAISVLTEENFFKGHLSYLHQIKKETSLPVLQKDFIIDPFQIYEGRVSGADAILLIAAILDREQLNDFVELTQSLHMAPLVEIHNEKDLEKILDFNLSLIGINNRDLKTFEVDLRTSLRLRRRIHSKIKVISESGIKSSKDVKILKWAGFDGILVGEILMRSNDPAMKIKELLNIWSG
jgi:indole-3-glycerol phosphate synthase